MKRSIITLAALLFGSGCLALNGCSSEATRPAEPQGTSQAAIYSNDYPTSIEASAPIVRTASCPHRKLPDQCGSWAGVELAASRSYWPPRSSDGEHCLCQAIDFEIPASIPVTRGNAGAQLAELEFRRTNGRTTRCFYRGDQRFSRGKLVGGNEYDFAFCNDGSRAGQSAKADWFELELEGGNPFDGPTAIQLRLGEPDVIDGVVQEQVFFADDPRIAGASLHVPRGSAPAGQEFSLEVVPQIAVGSTIENGGSALQTTGYAVDVHAAGVSDFVFTPVPGAACARIELPYDPAKLAAIAGPAAVGRLRARQITSLAEVPTGASVLASTGPLTVNPAQHTASFCVEHLSYYVTGVDSADGNLTGAWIAEKPVSACGTGCTGSKVCVAGGCYFNVLAAAPPALKPSTAHALRLEFTNEGVLAWTAANLRLWSMAPRNAAPNVPPTTPPYTPTTLTSSPWFPGVAGAFSLVYGGSNVAQNGTATFNVDVTTPDQEVQYGSYPFGGLLNLCLQRGTTWLSECFSWDYPVHSASNRGLSVAQLTEVCDGIDNDNDASQLVDDGPNGCGGICPLNLGAACNNGEQGACFLSGQYVCDGGARNATRCSVGSGAGLATAEICANGADEDCSGTPDDGDCCAPGATQCVGPGGHYTQGCGSDGHWGGSSLVVGSCGAICDGPVACGECGAGTAACNDGIPSGVCTGDAAKIAFYSDADGDSWCTTTSIDACPNARPERTLTSAECSDSTWGFRPDCIDSNGSVQNGCCEKLIYGPSYYKQCCGGPEVKSFDYDCGAGWHLQSCSLTRIEGFGKTSNHFLIMPDSCPIGTQTGTMSIEYGLSFLEGVEGFGVVHCLPDGLEEQPRSCPVF